MDDTIGILRQMLAGHAKNAELSEATGSNEAAWHRNRCRALQAAITSLESTGQTSDARDCPARFFASGPDACFFTDSAQFAEDTILAHDYDRDDWTITDLYAAMQEGGKS